MSDESMEEVPGSCSDPNVIMVYQCDEMFQNLSDINSLRLEERAISDTDFHILELDCWVGKVRNTCCQLVKLA